MQNQLHTLRAIRTISPLEILRTVSEVFGVNKDLILADTRTRYAAHPRILAMHLTRRLTSLSYARIGRLYNRHHGTVIHADQSWPSISHKFGYANQMHRICTILASSPKVSKTSVQTLITRADFLKSTLPTISGYSAL